MIWCFRCSIEKGIVSRIDILGDCEREEKCTKSVHNLFFGTNLSYKGLFQGSTEFFSNWIYSTNKEKWRFSDEFLSDAQDKFLDKNEPTG